MHAVPRRTRWFAVAIVFAAAVTWAAAALVERVTASIEYWIIWEATQALAVWTAARSWGLVRGRTETTVRMFSGWVFSLMVLASVLLTVPPFFLAFLGPSVAPSTPTYTAALVTMVVGICLWAFGTGLWVSGRK